MKNLTFAVPRYTERVVVALVDETEGENWPYLITMKEVKDWHGGSFIVSIFNEDCETIASKAMPMDDNNGVHFMTDVEIGFDEDIEVYTIGAWFAPEADRYYITVESK